MSGHRKDITRICTRLMLLRVLLFRLFLVSLVPLPLLDLVTQVNESILLLTGRRKSAMASLGCSGTVHAIIGAYPTQSELEASD